MSRFALDVLAGTVSSAASIAAGVIATPIYLALLGKESYGVIGFITALQATLLALDGGIAVSITRRVASSPAQDDETLKLLSGLSAFTWRAALVLAILVAACSEVLARHWLNLTILEAAYVAQAIAIASLLLAARWVGALYLAILSGRGLLLAASAVNTAATIVSTAGAIAILYWGSTDLRAMFAWLSLVAFAQTLWLAALVRGSLPGRARLTPGPIGAFLRASVPAGAIGVIGLALLQVDKLVLSRIVALEDFALYAVASLVTTALYALVSPLFNAVYPRLASFAGQGGPANVEIPYREASLALAAFYLPVACSLAFFSRPILMLWTHDGGVADGAAPLVTLLALGTAAHGMMFIPYALKLACGASRLALAISAATFALSLPLTVAMAMLWGTKGAAAAWLIVGVLYLVIGSQVTHRRILPTIGGRWLFQDVLPHSAFAVVVTSAGAAFAQSHQWSALSSAALAVIAVPICWMLSFACSSRLRSAAQQKLHTSLRRPA